MTTDRKVFWTAAVVVAVLLLVLLLSGKVQQELVPEPRAAWVAIEVAGGDAAEVGRVEIESGTPFTLHAVLETESWQGETVYFTDARRLRFHGVEVPPESLRQWKGSAEIRILWFTVEGFTPYLEVAQEDGLEVFHFSEFYRSEWPRSWSVPGQLEPKSESLKPVRPETGLPPFGTQRFHVRLEVFGPESRISPRQRFASWGAGDLPQKAERFPTVVASLPGLLQAPSRVFGLTQIEAGSGLSQERVRVAEWTRLGIAFSRLEVLRQILDQAGVEYDELAWVEADLAHGPPWGDGGVKAGDLLRAGERQVMMLKDEGVAATLDYDDLCIDLFKGASIRPLREVFAGEGLVQWASLQ
jgi:hypothetical protein